MQPAQSVYFYFLCFGGLSLAWGTLQKKEQKDCKTQEIREFAVILYLLVMSETKLMKI